MRIPRIFINNPLAPGTTVALDRTASNHLLRVLRLKPGAPLVLFDGQGGEYEAKLDAATRNDVTACVERYRDVERESPLPLTLAQGISRGERMDYTIQKAVELGAHHIVPLFTDRCEVKLPPDRAAKKRGHWERVAASACEQCGRNRVPSIDPPTTLPSWLAAVRDDPAPNTLYGVLDHSGQPPLAVSPDVPQAVTLLIGPEGGFSDQELTAVEKAGFIAIRLGPRTLRTETAAVAALSAIHALWGDFKD